MKHIFIYYVSILKKTQKQNILCINKYTYIRTCIYIYIYIWNPLVATTPSPGLPHSVEPKAATQSCDNGASCRELKSESPEDGVRRGRFCRIWGGGVLNFLGMYAPQHKSQTTHETMDSHDVFWKL